MTNLTYDLHRKALTKVILLLALLSSTPYAHARQNSVLIYIRDDVYVDYQQFVAGKDISVQLNSGMVVRTQIQHIYSE
mgnify:CR=1 FL=1